MEGYGTTRRRTGREAVSPTATPRPTRGAGDPGAAGAALLSAYDRSLPQVYGYLVARVGVPAVAEDLTSETYLAAVDAIGRGTLREPTTAWLIGVARHKLVDHWRRQGREERRLSAVADLTETVDDPWTVRLEIAHAREVLAGLGPHHRSALTLRYLDGLAVAEVAMALDRTLHATEALLVRARRAFRTAYETDQGGTVDA
ncbi:MAG: putative polymerase sigma factor [Acidimicrobiales bacterium]|nr:putative polymerase sigma factor [Acidimicrobiales bacterium]